MPCCCTADTEFNRVHKKLWTAALKIQVMASLPNNGRCNFPIIVAAQNGRALQNGH